MKKAVVVLSGGQDSVTCLYWALREGYDVHCVTFDYDQKHEVEINSARMQAAIAGVPWELVKLGPVLKGTSPLVDPQAELEQYENYNVLPGGLEKTFVPLRNQLFLTLAANRAYCLEADTIITGVCQEDFGGYPDCRQTFIDALADACCKATDKPMNIVTPLMDLSKAESVHLAIELSRDGFYAYEALSLSHTAYDGQYPPTGQDHATLLRAKGFAEAGVADPLWIRAVLEHDSESYPELTTEQREALHECEQRVADWLSLGDVQRARG